MERATREIRTKGDHKVVFHDYITGREQRSIQEVFLRKVEISRVSQADGKTDAGVSGFSAAAIAEAQDLAFKLLIVSMDDSNENIVQRVLDLPAEEFDEVVAVINEITEPKKK
jgi:hypothetical protein